MDDKKTLEKFNEYISKYIKDEKINHAYLLETNLDNKVELAKEIVKKILLYTSKSTVEDLIKDNDLLIISTQTNNIKTEEIEKIKETFSTKSIQGNKRIYIINEAEKLNDFAANKLLKFIEEPEEDIIAILTTSNKNKVISTIVSRCQNLRFFIADNKFDKYDREYLDKMFDFINNIEENKEQAIAFQNRIDTKSLSDRSYALEFLNNLLYVYDDVIQYKIENSVTHFPLYIDIIEKISNNNELLNIQKKINAINTCIDRLKYNPNIKLLVDKLILLMTGVDHNE